MTSSYAYGRAKQRECDVMLQALGLKLLVTTVQTKFGQKDVMGADKVYSVPDQSPLKPSLGHIRRLYVQVCTKSGISHHLGRISDFWPYFIPSEQVWLVCYIPPHRDRKGNWVNVVSWEVHEVFEKEDGKLGHKLIDVKLC